MHPTPPNIYAPRRAATIAEVRAAGGYDVISLDPAWQYDDRGCEGAAENHYRTMPDRDIYALPVGDIAARDCALFLWGTWPKLPVVLEAIERWGFKFKTLAFVWIKYRASRAEQAEELRAQARALLELADLIEGLREDAMIPDWLRPSPFMGLGNWTRGNTEPCLLAVRGKPRRYGRGVSQLIEEHEPEILRAPLTRHSAKPREYRDKVVQLMGADRAYLEMFARERDPRFDAWGDELPGGPDVILTDRDWELARAT